MPQAGGDKRTRIGWVPWRKRGLQGQTILALCFALTAMNAITDQLEWGEDTLLFLSCFLIFFFPSRSETSLSPDTPESSRGCETPLHLLLAAAAAVCSRAGLRPGAQQSTRTPPRPPRQRRSSQPFAAGRRGASSSAFLVQVGHQPKPQASRKAGPLS